MDEGEPPLSKILRRNPHNAPILVQYGHTLKETGRLGQAETAYRKAIAWGAGVSDNYVQLGHVLKLEGKLDDARTAYLVAFVLDPAGIDAARELDELGWPTEALVRGATAAPGGGNTAPAAPTPKPAVSRTPSQFKCHHLLQRRV